MQLSGRETWVKDFGGIEMLMRERHLEAIGLRLEKYLGWIERLGYFVNKITGLNDIRT